MKRFIALVLSLVMALSLCVPAWAEVASPTDLEGKGTAESPYLVDTADELAAAIEKGGIVELTNEVIISESLPVTKNTVLDLNGKKIGTSGSTTGSPLYLQGGELTVKNGTLDLDGKLTNVNGTFSVAIGYEAQTKLVVENVNFTGKTAINGAVVVDGPLNIAISDCTMDVTKSGIVVSANSTEAIATINNCNIDADEYAVFASQGSKITINGGTYKSAGKVITSMYDNTVVTINGGTFDGELWVTDGGSLVIYGGTFSVNPTPYVPNDGWYTITKGDDTWTVTKKDPVAKIGEVEYKTLAEAVAAADGGEVELLSDVTLSEQIKITKDVTLVSDAAVTVNTGAIAEAFKVSSGKLTVGKEVTLSGSNSIIEIYGGECVIDGATVTTSSSANCAIGVDEADATLTVKSGTVSSTGDHGSAIGMVDGTVNIQGGTIFVTSNSDMATIFNHGGTVNVTGGTIKNEGSGKALLASSAYGGTAVVNVSGGYIDNVAVHETNGGTVSVTGGYFVTAPSATYVAKGYICAFSSAANAYAVQKVTTENTTATTTTNTAVVEKEVIEAVKNAMNSSDNTVTVPVSGNTEAKTVIEFADGGKAAYVAEVNSNAAAPDITTELAVADVSKAVHEAVKEDIKTEAANEVSEDAKIATYLDIDIHVFVDDQHVGQITELPEAIKVVVPAEALPEFEDVASGYTRQFYVVRLHDGETETIRAKLDKDGNLVFESHLFSTYAVVYKDVKVYSGSGYYPVVGGTSTSTTDKTVTSAKTFDAGIGMYVAMSVMAAAGSAVVIGKKRED